MSWDVFLFNTKQKVETIEEIDEGLLEPTDFCSIFEHHFSKIGRDDNYLEIQGEDFSIGYFVDETPVSNKMLMLHGANALYAIIQLAQKHQWLVFDTYLGELLDLESPERNGYENFRDYVQQIMEEKKKE